MWSRRKFIFSILTGYTLWFNFGSKSVFALSKKKGHFDPRLITAEYWPSAISCNFLDVFGDNLCCMVDDLGRLAIADILPAAQQARPYTILGEISNLGSKVLFFKTITPQLALLISSKKKDCTVVKEKDNQVAAGQENQFFCHLINLENSRAPLIVSSNLLPNYVRINTFAVGSLKNRPVLCVAATDRNGDNHLEFFALKGKSKLQTLSSLRLKEPAKTVILGTETLLILHENSRASIFTVNNITNPQLIRTVPLNVQISAVNNYNDICAWSSQQDAKCVITTSDLKNFPQAISKIDVDGLSSVGNLAMNSKYILALGNDEDNTVVTPFLIDKNRGLRQQETVKLSGYIENSSVPSKIVIGKEAAFISSGWAGVQVITTNHKGAWLANTCFGLQRLPIAGIATWSNFLLLAGAELRLYDLSQSKHPKLISNTKVASTIKTIVSAGSYVLCLDKSGVSLRKIESAEKILVSLPIKAEHLSYDNISHKAYLIQSTSESENKQKKLDAAKSESTKAQTPKGKSAKPEPVKLEAATLVELNVYNNSIQKAKSFSVIEDCYCSSADEGYVLLGNLDSLAMYKPDQNNELVCKREFKDLAWREIVLRKGNIFATAIDQNVNGFFLTMSFDGQSINLLQSIKLPHDGMALKVNENLAFTAGQSPDGNSLLTAIDISDNSAPKILSTKSALQSASVISSSNNLVIVGGQGFEIFSN